LAAHRSSRQITYKKLDGWMCEVVSGMFSLGGWRGMDWREKVTIKLQKMINLQKQPRCIKKCGFVQNGQCEKKCEIKGNGQKMALMI